MTCETCERVSRESEALDVVLYLYPWNVNIFRNCPCYFAHVGEQDFESTWLWDVKTRLEQLCVSAFVDLWFQSRQIAQFLSGHILFIS